MPRFTTRLVKEVQEPTVTDSLIQKYGAYISRIDGDSVGVLKFRESEDITLAREALRLAAEKQGKDLIIRRPRGVDGVLEFRLRNR